MKKLKDIIPWFPLSAVIAIMMMIILWEFHLIPSLDKMLIVLENLYSQIGLPGLFIIAFIEGIAYFGNYFPGSTIIILSLIISGENFYSLIPIIIVVAIALTISSIVNYMLGNIFRKKNKKIEKQKAESIFFLSCLHPVFLGLYFFYCGLKGKNLRNVFYVPFVIIPYGFILAILISYTALFVRESILTNQIFFLTIFILWFIFELVIKNKKEIRNFVKRVEG